MSTGQPHDVLRHLRLLKDGGEMTDGQLLGCFVAQRDDAAFEALVRRHGPMVLGVCRRVLRNDHDAEDAFQATFLLLVRKAASIRQRELLGNWLYGVAYRTAMDARAAASRRRVREKQMSTMPEPEAADEPILWRDLHPVLDEELNRLPEKYRVPVVLCDLEGGTRRDVARQLGIPLGTLSGRLTTARRLLAKRLAGRGLVLSAGALMVALSPDATLACLPSPLIASTVAAASAVAVGQSAISAEVAALTESGMKAMLVSKRKSAVWVLLAVGAVLGTGLFAYLRDGWDASRSKILKLDARGRRVTWSPDGKTLAVVTKVEKMFLGFQYDRKGSAIRLWDVETGLVKQTLAESTQPGLAFQQVIFSFDGKTLAAAEGNVVELWDAKTLDVKQALGGHQLVCVAFSPDGKLVAAGDPSNKIVKLWNAETGSLERTLDSGEAQPWSLAFSPDGKTLVVGGLKDDRNFESRNQVDLVSGQVQWWDVQTGTQKRRVKQDQYVNTVGFSANGKLLASGGGGDLVLLWDAQTGELIHSLKGLGSGTYGVAFSPDGQTVAAGGKDGKVRLWDAQTGNPKAALKGHGSGVYSIAFSPDGNTLASVSQDQTLRLWPIDNPK